MSASALASAYRATTHFTPRDGVAEPTWRRLPPRLVGYPILEPRGFPGTDGGCSEPCVSLLRLSGQGAQGAAIAVSQSSVRVRPLSSPLGQMPWPLYLMPLGPSRQDEESVSLQRPCNVVSFAYASTSHA